LQVTCVFNVAWKPEEECIADQLGKEQAK